MELVSRLTLQLRRQWLTIALGAIAVALAFDFAIGPLGLRDLMALRARRTQLEATHRQLLNSNAALKLKLERLSSDNGYLERRIREQLGYVRPDELVYRFAAESSSADR
jgi:cell division protein FtsB